MSGPLGVFPMENSRLHLRELVSRHGKVEACRIERRLVCGCGLVREITVRLARGLAIAAMLGHIVWASHAFGQERPVLLRDSFPIGNDDGVLCQVQDRSIENPAKQSMFDRNWAVRMPFRRLR